MQGRVHQQELLHGDFGEYVLEAPVGGPLVQREDPTAPVFGGQRGGFQRVDIRFDPHLVEDLPSEFGAGHPRDDTGVAFAEAFGESADHEVRHEAVRIDPAGVDGVLHGLSEADHGIVEIDIGIGAGHRPSPPRGPGRGCNPLRGPVRCSSSGTPFWPSCPCP